MARVAICGVERHMRYAALWTQIVGKIRLVQTPWLNHSWHVALYVTARGLTTSPIPYRERAFQIDFDFVDHVLWVRTSDGNFRQVLLRPMSVAQLYTELFDAMAELGSMCGSRRCRARSLIHSLRSGPLARLLRSRLRRSLLARVALDARGARPFPNGLSRQGEPSTFLLGQLRPGGHPLLREARTASSWRGASSARRRRGGGIFARGVQRGLLARRGRASGLRSLLFLRLSGSAGFCPRSRATSPGVLFPRTGRIYSILRRRPQRAGPRAHVDEISPDYVRGRSRSRPMGSCRVGMFIGGAWTTAIGPVSQPH